MRVIGLPTKWDEDKGLLPVDIQDVDIHGTTAEELEELASFFASAAKQFREPGFADTSTELKDSKPNPKTGICFTVYSGE